jgi:hypothetical protein
MPRLVPCDLPKGKKGAEFMATPLGYVATVGNAINRANDAISNMMFVGGRTICDGTAPANEDPVVGGVVRVTGTGFYTVTSNANGQAISFALWFPDRGGRKQR